MSRFQRIRHLDLPQTTARRAIRAGILVPSTFAISYLLLHNPNAAVFSAVGSVSLLLYVDFGGPVRQRLQNQFGLILTTLVLLCLGTLAEQNIWVGTVVTLVVTFAILFSGIISSVLASAQTTMLISFLLPLTIAGPLSVLPDRLLGWSIAAAGSLIAITVIWRGPTNEPLRTAAVKSLGALAAQARDLADGEAPRADHPVMLPDVAALKRSFLGAPYRPSGLGTAGRELAKLIEQQLQLERVLRGIVAEAPTLTESESRVLECCATILTECGTVLATAKSDTAPLSARRAELADIRNTMEAEAISTATAIPGGASAHEWRTALAAVIRPSFDAQEFAVIVDGLAERTILSATARNRSWFAQLAGLRTGTVAPAVSTARDRLGSHFDWRSVWLHNALRGSAGFTLTVFVANAIGVQHAFWVVFGTLAVLRSNASATGQTAVRAILGTLAGIIIGGALVEVIGSNTTVCWILLPIIVAFTGLAPAFSFAAGQAGFSVFLILLFDLISPIGWTIGIVRIEDVALGCAVSIVVSLLLWPRGASAAFSAVLATALEDAAQYLAGSIDYALERCGHHRGEARALADGERVEASDAGRRLDDSLRQLLSERGSKLLSFDEVACMVNAATAVRRTADEIRALWDRSGATPGVSEEARARLVESGSRIVGRYEQVASALRGIGQVPDAASEADRNTDTAIDAIWAQAGTPDDALGGTVRLVWTLDYIEALGGLDRALLPAANHAVEALASKASWLVGIRRGRSASRAQTAVL